VLHFTILFKLLLDVCWDRCVFTGSIVERRKPDMYEISAESEGVTISHLADGCYAGQLVVKMIFMETHDFINPDNGSRRPRLLPRRRNGPIVVPLDALDAATLHHPPSCRRSALDGEPKR
jgi:hypothetical protein